MSARGEGDVGVRRLDDERQRRMDIDGCIAELVKNGTKRAYSYPDNGLKDHGSKSLEMETSIVAALRSTAEAR